MLFGNKFTLCKDFNDKIFLRLEVSGSELGIVISSGNFVLLFHIHHVENKVFPVHGMTS
jgi:hypothetical protein